MNAAGLQVQLKQMTPMRLDVELNCVPGKLLAVVGPSGSGKTSVLRAIAGLMTPQQGQITVDGAVWFKADHGATTINLTTQQRRVGMVFQSYALMPHMTALQNVVLACAGSGNERLMQSRQLLHSVGLEVYVDVYPHELSGGQQQRVALARALARRPQLLLLDEPFSAVDQLTRVELYGLLADLRSRLSTPILLVTHDLNEARLLADEILVLDQGRSLQQGRPEQVYRAPRNARVADLVGIQNRFEGVFQGSTMLWGSPPEATMLAVHDKGRIPHGSAVSWIVPGEGIHVRRQAAQLEHPLRAFPASIAGLRTLGDIVSMDLHLQTPKDQRVRVTMSLSELQQQQWQVGQAVYLGLDTRLIHIMPIKGHRPTSAPL